MRYPAQDPELLSGDLMIIRRLRRINVIDKIGPGRRCLSGGNCNASMLLEGSLGLLRVRRGVRSSKRFLNGLGSGSHLEGCERQRRRRRR